MAPPLAPPVHTLHHDALIYGNDWFQVFKFVHKDGWLVRCWLGTHYGVQSLPRNWCVL